MSEGVLEMCMSRGWGGLEMYPSRLAPALSNRGWRVHCVTLEGARLGEEMRKQGVEVLEYSSVTRALCRVCRLRRWIRARKISVLHCHKSSDLRLAALLKSGMPSLRIVFTEHMGVSRPKRDLYHRWAFGKVDQVISISEATLARNKKALPVAPERIARLYHGVDVAEFGAHSGMAQQQVRRSLGIEQNDIAVGLAARITPGKGHDVFLDALAQLPASSRVRGLIIGGLDSSCGSSEEFVSELRHKVVAAGLESRVQFVGFRSDLADVLGALDIVCVPSPNEAFGLTAIEAMAMSRPVIGSDSGALPEILGNGAGILADPQQPSEWCEAIVRLENDARLRDELGKAGRARVEQQFSLERHLDTLINYYRGIPVS
ncbi:glycosyltransferase family 4 protein [Carnimonas nigrificans]|uniref:glycosyltransferase family 4 protein n=1 Tax=Carnimonas nigrificans TaxID=64323 RepID=UPI000470DFBA|nr:glycosyltransferase family 4 protein [Carnimonas nigrificans]